MSLLQYIVRRILVIPLVIVGITLMTFLTSNLVPSSPESAFLGQRALSKPEVVEAFRRKWGLDKPLPVRYLTYIFNLAHGDFGVSIGSGRPVIEDLKKYLPATIELATVATLLAVVLGIPLGVIAAVNYERWSDHAIRALTLIGASAPFFWMAMIALWLFWAKLDWLPGQGRLSLQLAAPTHITGLYIVDSLLTGNWPVLKDSLRHLVLPALVLALNQMAFITRITRSSMLDELEKDYIRTARAKGQSEMLVHFRHALRNALIPVVSYLGVAYGGLLAGAIITETVFAFPGLGRYAFRGASRLDFAALMSVVTVVAVIYVVVNLAVDVIHSMMDPRIRYG